MNHISYIALLYRIVFIYISCFFIRFFFHLFSYMHFFFFFFNDTATTEIYTLSLHDALPISGAIQINHMVTVKTSVDRRAADSVRSEEHTSELQSRRDLVCRLLLEKKKKK